MRWTWSRTSRSPSRLIAEITAVRRLYSQLQPDVVHQIALKPVALGSLAGLGMDFATVNSIAGLGISSVANSLKAKMLGKGAIPVLRTLLNRAKTRTIVQNQDDLAFLVGLRVKSEKLSLIHGSGVDTDALVPLPEPDAPFTVGFAARMLEFKGVRELVEAHQALIREGLDIRLLLAGAPDETNSGAIPLAELRRWADLPGVEVLGHLADVRDLWRRCHVAVLPSRGGEGVPKALLDAAACGRALISTDTPGCRDLVRPGVNGWLVPPRNAGALAQVLSEAAKHPAKRRAFGEASRAVVEAEYSSAIVGEEMAVIYRRAIANNAESFP